MLYFRKWNFFYLMLKKLLFFLGETLVFFISSCFHSLLFSFILVFISSCFCFFSCFYCWLLLFTSLFLHCLSGTLFLCWYRKCYGSERTFFTLSRFLPCFPSWFYQGFPGASSSALKVAGLSTEVWNTDPAHLFLWII